MFFFFFEFIFTEKITESLKTRGENISCGDGLCTGLCINYITYEYLLIYNQTVIHENESYCYAGHYEWCFVSYTIFIWIPVIFILPLTLTIIYVGIFKDLSSIKSMNPFFFWNRLFLQFLANLSLGFFISSLYCLLNYNDKTSPTNPTILGLSACFMISGIFFSFLLAINSRKMIKFGFYYPLIGTSICTKEETFHHISNVLMSPPIFNIQQKIGKNVQTNKNLHYKTWEETSNFNGIPKNDVNVIIFDVNVEYSNEMYQQYISMCSQNNIFLNIEIDYNTNPIITGSKISFGIKLLLKNWMKYVYWLFCVFDYQYIIDLLFWANCKLCIVKSMKKASNENIYRANGQINFINFTVIICEMLEGNYLMTFHIINPCLMIFFFDYAQSLVYRFITTRYCSIFQVKITF